MKLKILTNFIILGLVNLSAYQLKAEECLFIDDRQINIDGGKALGIQGYLFDGNAEKLREFINHHPDMAFSLSE